MNKELIKKFKVGDWVVDTQDGALYKIKEIKEFPEEPMYKRFTLSNTEETWIDIYNDEIDTDGWELWQPTIGEWCWFWNNGYEKEPTLAQLKYKGAKLMSTLDGMGYFEYCEPFIGQLPSFLKDNT